ncbi:MAG: NADH-quinone oxidoreductase subunit NuoG [Nitrosomonadales bacterium]
MIKIKLNGKTIEVKPKTTIIQVADEHGIEIPRFCYHKKLSVAANCRMCLVEVKNFPKPMPACATQVTEGMEISTRSQKTKEMQKSVMEFLLINHPLDCPICDQGGECDLQDIALGYGKIKSRYQEEKRVVMNKNLGPLVSTDLNRCIQCSRCVRFLQEVSGIQELGLIGRGEHAEISAYVEKSVESELSGNIIDLCPVGALTSKPFRYSARGWELARKLTVSPHDSFGSNLEAHTKNNDVLRVVPVENEDINECWISDRDRFSYLGISHLDRIKKPMKKTKGSWQEIEWSEAFDLLEEKAEPNQNKLKDQDYTFFASEQLTMEEGFLLKRLVNHLGSTQVRYSKKPNPMILKTPWLNNQIKEFERFKNFVVIGSGLKEQNPMLLHKLRKAANHGAKVHLITDSDEFLKIKEASKTKLDINDLKEVLNKIYKLKNLKNKPKNIYEEIAQDLSKDSVILICNNLLYSYIAAEISDPINKILKKTKANISFAPSEVNAVGLAGLFEKDKFNISKNKSKITFTLNIEPEIDYEDFPKYQDKLKHANFNVFISAFMPKVKNNYDLILPTVSHFENEGSFISVENRQQVFNQVLNPKYEAKPLWKILRVIGNYLGVPNFNYETCSEIRNEIPQNNFKNINALIVDNNILKTVSKKSVLFTNPIYFSDALVRRSDALQKVFIGKGRKS